MGGKTSTSMPASSSPQFPVSSYGKGFSPMPGSTMAAPTATPTATPAAVAASPPAAAAASVAAKATPAATSPMPVATGKGSTPISSPAAQFDGGPGEEQALANMKPVATGKGSLPIQSRPGLAEGGIPKFKNFKKPPIPMRRPHAPRMEHAGPIHSSVAGRTDHLPMHVHSGSYVIPADIISGMGEGNTIAGFKHMRRVFGGNPYGSGSAPYGQAGGPYGAPMGKADGGSAEKHADGSVPIVAAGGEYVLTPDEVRAAGGGDLEAGHKVLDAFVLRMRKELVKTLKGLEPPRKD